MHIEEHKLEKLYCQSLKLLNTKNAEVACTKFSNKFSDIVLELENNMKNKNSIDIGKYNS